MILAQYTIEENGKTHVLGSKQEVITFFIELSQDVVTHGSSCIDTLRISNRKQQDAFRNVFFENDKCIIWECRINQNYKLAKIQIKGDANKSKFLKTVFLKKSPDSWILQDILVLKGHMKGSLMIYKAPEQFYNIIGMRRVHNITAGTILHIEDNELLSIFATSQTEFLMLDHRYS